MKLTLLLIFSLQTNILVTILSIQSSFLKIEAFLRKRVFETLKEGRTQ